MPLSSGAYKLTNVSLNLPLAPKGNAVNAEIVALPDDLTDMFKWRLVHISGDTYNITNMANDLSCYVGSNVFPPANLIAAPNSQRWNIIPVRDLPDAYTIAAADNNMYWSMSSIESGANVILSKTGGGRLQHWTIERPGMFLPTGNYKLKNLMIDLPIKPKVDALNEAVIAARDDHSDDFKWTITYITRGVYTIVNARNGYYLHGDITLKPGATVTLQKEKQYFAITPAGTNQRDTWYIVALENNNGVYLGLDSWMPDAKVITGDDDSMKKSFDKDLYRWVIKKA